jgi:hypothetical protein
MRGRWCYEYWLTTRPGESWTGHRTECKETSGRRQQSHTPYGPARRGKLGEVKLERELGKVKLTVTQLSGQLPAEHVPN